MGFDCEKCLEFFDYWKHLLEPVLKAVGPFWTAVATIVSAMALLLSIITLWNRASVFIRGIQLYHRTLLCSLPTAYMRLFSAFWNITAERMYRETRIRVELEVLYPRPTKPFPLPQDPDERREAKEDYRFDKDKWETKRAELREDLSSRLHEGKPPEISVPTCFALYKADQAKIGRYFDALKSQKGVPSTEKGRFVCSVKVENGFVAPLHLLTGLLAHFNEDWEPVIDEYGKSVTQPDDPLPPDCRKLQTFLFDCWMLWGPSVPLCQCENWEGRKAIQYGFGDENNSIPLFFNDDAELTKLLTSEGAKANLAFRMEVTGRPRTGLRTKEVCPAQQGICDADRYGFVLEYEHHIPLLGGRPEERANRYYSAYAWIMFVLLDERGRPLIEKKEERWRNLFPFFEHTNIADRKTYELMKEQLVRKALTGISHLVCKDTSATWHLAYACALDDSGCGTSLPFPHHGRPIKETLQTLLGSPEFADLRKSGRILVEDKPDPRYSACHLPEILEDYYGSLKSLGQSHRA